MRSWLALWGALALAIPASGEELVDGIAAQVGSEIVLISEVRQLSDPVVQNMRAAGAPVMPRLCASAWSSSVSRRISGLCIRAKPSGGRLCSRQIASRTDSSLMSRLSPK